MIAAIALLAAAADRGRAPALASDDDELVARHREGDPDAFAAIYRAHVAAVYRRISRILGPIAEREDLVQDVFLALHKALPRFRGEARLSTLIHRIAINKAYEHLRRRGRRVMLPFDAALFDEVLVHTGTPEERVAARQELVAVFGCLARIKPKKRIAFLLRVVDGLSFEEIGVLVDASPETVAKRVQHGQRELDALLARSADEPARRYA
jgi:RNA polymerase sigma-70 factor (ECF subfamily)